MGKISHVFYQRQMTKKDNKFTVTIDTSKIS
eukprot:UN06511